VFADFFFNHTPTNPRQIMLIPAYMLIEVPIEFPNEHVYFGSKNPMTPIAPRDAPKTMSVSLIIFRFKYATIGKFMFIFIVKLNAKTRLCQTFYQAQ
jgi:hypothetical protein